MRRLLFVGGTSDPGGLQIHTADVAQAAAALGHSVSIVSGEKDNFTRIIPGDKISFETRGRLSLARLRRRPIRHTFIRAWEWLSVLRKYRDHDLIFCRGSFAETPVLDLILARALGRTVYTIEHSQWGLEWPFVMSKPRYGRVMNACVKRVITVSTEVADIAKAEFLVAADRLRVCFNWVDPKFRPASID